MKMNEPENENMGVVTVCYGETREWSNREDAKQIMEFYSKIDAENEKLAAGMQRAKEKIEANNKKKNNKIISDLETRCKAGKISMTDILRLADAVVSGGCSMDDAIAAINSVSADVKTDVKQESKDNESSNNADEK